MKELTAVPRWWGIFLFILAGVFSFPAVGHLLEGHQSELWELKTHTMGDYYPTGMLVWSYISLVVTAFFVGIGYQIIRNIDPKAE